MIDWTSSGIVHSMRYELVGRDRQTHISNMSGVTRCSLDFGYYTDIKAIGTLYVDGCDYVEGAMVRIWYEPSLDGEKEHVCLGTFYVTGSQLRYERGRYFGTMELSSVLAKYTRDVCETDTVIAKGRSAKGWWWSAMRWCGATGSIDASIDDRTFNNAVIFEFGTQKIQVLHAIADFLDGQVGVTEKGVISLTKYVAPSKRPVSYTIPIGNRSVTMLGVEYDDGAGEAINRVVVRFDNSSNAKKSDEKSVIYGLADLPGSSKYSFSKTGIRTTSSYDIDDMSPRTKERADEIAQRLLDANSKPSSTWQMKCSYLPIHEGDVIRFRYQDDPRDTGIDVDAMVSERRLDEDGTGITMTCTLKEIRRRHA